MHITVLVFSILHFCIGTRQSYGENRALEPTAISEPRAVMATGGHGPGKKCSNYGTSQPVKGVTEHHAIDLIPRQDPPVLTVQDWTFCTTSKREIPFLNGIEDQIGSCDLSQVMDVFLEIFIANAVDGTLIIQSPLFRQFHGTEKYEIRNKKSWLYKFPEVTSDFVDTMRREKLQIYIPPDDFDPADPPEVVICWQLNCSPATRLTRQLPGN